MEFQDDKQVFILLDIGVQLNVWRIIAVSEKRAQDIANMVVPGLGLFLAILIVIGGLAFNIGNVGGAGLGLNVLFGISPQVGAILTAVIAIGVFLVKEAGKLMDRFAQLMGGVLILLMIYVAFSSSPPVGEAIAKSFMPDQIDVIAIVTLVGGTVGGYITFAGGHRLLDAGIKGKAAIPEVTRGAVSGITIASLVRIFLFLATLGVISQGFTLNPDNPPASVFQLAAGNVGYKLFGVVMAAAAITSVIGSAYTSVSFIKSFNEKIAQYENWVIIGFITVSTLVFLTIGQPVTLLILAGALNGLILPISLGTMLVAAYKKKIVGDYKHPLWLTIFGSFVVVIMAVMGVYTLFKQLGQLF